MAKSKQSLRWKFDVNTFRLLGRELITDRVTAIFELVKNCYDANATVVDIDFINVSTKGNSGQIIVTDNGQGMTFEDIRDKWMVVGTNSKRERTSSGPPLFRKMVGEKGVGRFAVEKLGSRLILQSKKASQSVQVNVEIIWDTYEELSSQYSLFKIDLADPNQKSTDKTKKQPTKKYFTEIDNEYWYETKNDSSQSTKLLISNLREVWTENDILRVYKELAKLISPIAEQQEDFTINIKAGDFENFATPKKIENKNIAETAISFKLNYDLDKQTQQIIKFESDKLILSSVPIQKMGPVQMVLYYLDSDAKRVYKSLTGGDSPDGVKIYRDNLITTPFAEFESHDDKKRDVLGIDKRKHNAFFEKVGSRDLIGIVAITKSQNPQIIDATNRQDFVDNEEYRALKQFIIDQVIELEKLLKYQREAGRQVTTSSLQSAREELNTFTQVVQNTIKEAPQFTEQLSPLLKVAKRVRVDFTKGIKAYERLEKEKVRQENIFMSLMSLQEYAAQIAHVVRTSLARVLHLAEFIKDFFPNEEYSDLFASYSKSIYDEMITLDRAIEYMLSYALADTDKSDIDLKESIDNLMFGNYGLIFTQKGIKAIVEVNKSVIIKTNQRVLVDIFENLITNSIKAVQDNEGDKIIKCTATIDDEKVEIIFSDNGKGIDIDDYERIFNVYYTTTAEQGGAGIGLFVAKTRVESLKGKIQVIKPEFYPIGATFKITFPFDK